MSRKKCGLPVTLQSWVARRLPSTGCSPNQNGGDKAVPGGLSEESRHLIGSPWNAPMTLIDVPGQAQNCSAPVVSIVWGFSGTPIETLVPFQDLPANFRRTLRRAPPGRGLSKCVDVDNDSGNSLWKARSGRRTGPE